jgi:dipeptidyl aminopeptidase/acylaminoacyl peptidase
VVYEANTFIRKVTPGSHQQISYQSLDGKGLRGWLLLPPGYKPGKRYPLIVWVYPGWMAGPVPDGRDNLSYESPLNLQILAANGYVVLTPSVPFNYGPGPDDVLLRLTSGVLPAVDKVIELGIADPNRIFAMGHSFGGYAIFGLVTQTHRFKAAVTLAGYSDMVSGYNQFGTWRYHDYSDEMLTATQPAAMESLLGFGVPPWSDLGRYLRNSPIFYVDRVETPLMIIHGDFDGMPMEQAEEFFMALYRQGKRAEFVRYWGEGHVLVSPANIRDMWARIFAWLEEFSPKPTERAGDTTRRRQ